MIPATSRGAELLWVILPYLAIATFVVGHVWRWRRDQFTWTTRSTQLLESRLLKFGGPLFHYGLLAVIGGHVIGILIPQSFTESLGIHESLYRDFSATMGTLAGTTMLAGLLILLYRRATDRRVAATTRRMDVAVLALLAFMVASGMWNTVFENVIQGGYDYRATVSPWFRGLFLLDPKASLMSGGAIPLSYQLHAIAGWLLIGLWPFTRLVHAWSVPVTYLRRRPIVYRARASRGVRVGAGGLSFPTPVKPDPALDAGPTQRQGAVHVPQ
jgi:respiratory nitrate reductase gamma subunit